MPGRALRPRYQAPAPAPALCRAGPRHGWRRKSGPVKTLADYLRPGLRVLSIGLNPSLPSVRAGVYFANPRNRFWPAFRQSGLTRNLGPPSPDELNRLMVEEGIGFTDVVKRPTRGGAELRKEDFLRDAPLLKEKILECQPAVAWFHGKQAIGHYLRHAEDRSAHNPDWGAQALTIGASRVFVTPNPSSANAAYSLNDLIEWYRLLARFVSSGN